MRVRPGNDLSIRHHDVLRHLFKDFLFDDARRAAVIGQQAVGLVDLDLDPEIVGLPGRLVADKYFGMPV